MAQPLIGQQPVARQECGFLLPNNTRCTRPVAKCRIGVPDARCHSHMRTLPTKPCPDCGLLIKGASERCSGCCARAQSRNYWRSGKGKQKLVERKSARENAKLQAISDYSRAPPALQALIDNIVQLRLKPTDLQKKADDAKAEAQPAGSA